MIGAWEWFVRTSYASGIEVYQCRIQNHSSQHNYVSDKNALTRTMAARFIFHRLIHICQVYDASIEGGKHLRRSRVLVNKVRQTKKDLLKQLGEEYHLNIAVLNTDTTSATMFLLSSQSWRLSPAYDTKSYCRQEGYTSTYRQLQGLRYSLAFEVIAFY